MAEAQQGWDTRAWVLGIVGGLVLGSMTGWFNYPPLVQKMHALGLPLNTNWSNGVNGIGVTVGVLILPGVVSGLARRRTFFWGLVPLVLFLFANDVEDWFEGGIKAVTKDFWLSIAIIGGCLFVSSGPVSLFRWLRVRARRRREAAVAFVQAQQMAAAIPSEGVWPPPPDYRA